MRFSRGGTELNQLFRTHCGRLRPACILAAVVFLTAGCGARGKEFRDAALPDIGRGLRAVLDGLGNGVFAAVEPEPNEVGGAAGNGP